MRSAAVLALALAATACDDGGGGEVPADAARAPAVDAARVTADATPDPADAGTPPPDAGDAGPSGALTPEEEYAAPPEPYAPPASLAADIPNADATDPACGARYVAGLRGWIVDRIGHPIGSAKAQVCIRTHPGDQLKCLLPATTGADGVFTQEVPDLERCMRRASLRVLHPQMTRATVYCEADIAAADGAGLLIEDPFVLFPTVPATELPPTGDDLAPRTVVFADGLELHEVVPRQFYATAESYEALAAWRISTEERGLCMLHGAPDMDGLYAFYPEGDVTDGALPVRIPNATGLAAGAGVELFVLGGLDCTLPGGGAVEEGVWQSVGTARVTADGAMIESDEGAGLPCLTWLGYRATDGG